MSLETRFIGTCQICEGRQRLREEITPNRHGAGPVKTEYKLVHHGYKRPGDGYIHGDCFGVGYQPYELGTDACEIYRAQCERTAAAQTEMLAKLEAGEIRTLSVLVQRSYREQPTLETYSLDSTDPLEHAKFRRALEHKIQETTYSIKYWTRRSERMAQLIASWKPGRIITFQEWTEQVEAVKALARAERKAERAAKLAKTLDAARERKNRPMRRKARKQFKARARFERAWNFLDKTSIFSGPEVARAAVRDEEGRVLS